MARKVTNAALQRKSVIVVKAARERAARNSSNAIDAQ